VRLRARARARVACPIPGSLFRVIVCECMCVMECVSVRLIDGDRARETNKNILCAWDRERGIEQER